MKTKVNFILTWTLLVAVFVSVSAYAATEIICSSTTSTENSRLFGYILPLFEKKTGIRVKVVARGTGAAIEMGKRGDADVAFVHAKEQELKAAEEGFFVDRHDVMYNDFMIIGPYDDPAKIKGIKSAADAFKKIAGSVFLYLAGTIPALIQKNWQYGKKSG